MSVNQLTSMSYEEKMAKVLENKIFYEKVLLSMPKEMQLEYKSIPQSHQNLFLRVFCKEKVSMPDRIKYKCLDCAGFERNEIDKCTIIQCPIWSIRPFQSNKAIKKSATIQ